MVDRQVGPQNPNKLGRTTLPSVTRSRECGRVTPKLSNAQNRRGFFRLPMAVVRGGRAFPPRVSCGGLLALAFLAAPVSTSAAAAAVPDFASIDAHVAGIERPTSGNSVDFVQRLTKPARNDLERVRAIAWWIASHIAYDHEMFRDQFPQQQAGQAPLKAIAANKPDAVMRRGKAVCSGYAALFVALCRTIGIEAVEVSGKVRFNDVGHKWNAVRLNRTWQLLDITYMAAGAGNTRKGVGKPVGFYFLTDPELFVFSHLPNEPKWQLLPRPITRQEFAAVPPVLHPLLLMLVEPVMLRQAARDGVKEFVPAKLPDAGEVKLLEAPLGRELDTGTSYEFRVRADGCQAVFVDNGGDKSPLERRAGLFQGKVTPTGGFLRVGVQPRDGNGGVEGILDYRVGGQSRPLATASLADEIRRLVNEVRRRDGAKALRDDAGLDHMAAAHAQEMLRLNRTQDRPACLVAGVDTPGEASVAEFASQFVESLLLDAGRRSWACATVHSRLGVGTAAGNGRTYFCLEFH